MAVVVDASALVFATTETTPSARRLLGRLQQEVCHAPHLIDAELGNVLRRKVGRRELKEEHARVVLGQAPELVDHRYEHRGAMASAAWALRENVSFYDALYLVLAAAVDAPLVTLDRRLAVAPGLPCRVDVVVH
jgi:predicted nucleic acid-binding protein